MKRDINLVRDILFGIENDSRVESDESNDENVVYYHLHLMIRAGLIDGLEIREGEWQILGLTWAGHELLELIRDLNRWKTVKRILDDLNCYSFEIIKTVAISQMKL